MTSTSHPSLPRPRRGASRRSSAARSAADRCPSRRARTDAAAAKAWQSELWPNPRLRAEARDVPTRDGGPGSDAKRGDGEDWLLLMQPVDVSGRRGNAIEAARAGHEAARHAEDAERRALAAEIGRAWAEAVWDVTRAPIVAEAARIAVRRREIADARVRSGTLTESGALEARTAAAAAEIEARAAVRSLAVRMERLGSVAGVAVPAAEFAAEDSWSALPGLDELRALCLSTNPELRAAQAAADAASWSVREAVAGRVPEADLMFGVGRMPDGESRVEAGISFPLPVFDRNQARIREARAEAARMTAEREAAERALRAELAADHAMLLESRERAVSLGSIVVPAATRAVEQARSSFAGGTRSESELLDAEEALVRVRLELAAAQRDVRLAEIEIRRHLPQPHGIPGVEP